MKTKRLTERELRNASSSFVSYADLRRDALAKTRALRRIANLATTPGYDTKELDMAAIAKRALGEA